MTFRSSVTRFFERAAVDGARWLGVTARPNAVALLLALALLALATLFLAVGPIWRVYGWLPLSSLNSDRLRVTHALATHWQARLPDLMFVGGSQIREALPTEDFMEQSLSRACGRPVTVFNATSSAQPPESSWALVEMLGPRAPSLVVTGVNLWRDDRNHASARRLARALLPLGAPEHLSVDMGALDLGTGERLQNRLGLLFADARQVVSSAPIPRTGGPFDGSHNQYAPPGTTAEERIIDDRYVLLVASQTPDALVAFNVAFYRHFGEFAGKRGGRLLYLLPPIPPQSATVLAQLKARTSLALATLERSGELLDLRSISHMVAADFHDSVHMLRGGRERIWPTLQRSLIARLPDCGTAER
jgi:hypothetical protein